MITTSRKTKPTTPAMIHTNLDLNKLVSLVGTRAVKESNIHIFNF